ncbi:MAG: DNA-3-methyladenine glycosylase [Candidatus Dormibacter sp.]
MRRRGAAIARRLSRAFLSRDSAQVAPDLVGALIVTGAGTAAEVRARIVEVEAYRGGDDPASHAFRGSTPRAAIMFGAPGHLYVYLSYGIHHCANVVCAPVGIASAVLLRAAVVEQGEGTVRSRRGRLPARARLLSGPGNLCKGLGLAIADNGADLCNSGPIHLEAAAADVPLQVGPRVGIHRAVDLPLRFWWADHPAVSAPRSLRSHKGTGAEAGP